MMLVVVGLVGSLALAQPVNDRCNGALPILPTGAWPAYSPVVGVADAGMVAENTSSCIALSNLNSTVWFSFTPPASGTYLVHTCTPLTTLSDTVLSVYQGACVDGGVVNVSPDGGVDIACNDELCGSRSGVTMPMVAGTTYFIQASKYGTTGPALTDTVQVMVDLKPTNDSCSGTLPSLALNRVTPFSISPLATNDSQVVDAGSTCFVGLGHSTSGSNNLAPGRDVVFSFAPPAAGTYSIRMTSAQTVSSNNSVLYMTSACSSDPLTNYSAPVCVAASNRIGSAAASAEDLSCIALGTGPYYVWADETTTVAYPTLYDLEVSACFPETEPNNDPSTATALQCPITGSVATTDIDFISLGAPAAGSKVFALVEATSAGAAGSGSSDFDLRVTTDTSTLEYDDANADSLFGGSSGAVAGTPLLGGPSFLRVSNLGSAPTTTREPYRLYAAVQPPGEPTAEFEPNNTLATASGGASNFFAGSVTGSDVDVFAFQARVGEQIFVAIDPIPNRADAGTPVNHVLTLIDPDGLSRVVTTESGTAVNTTSFTGTLDAGSPAFPSDSLLFRARVDGLHYVRVSTASTTGRGDYHLSIARDCTIGGGVTAASLAAVTPNTGSIVGGTTVTLSGTNFNASTQVLIGGVPATITARSQTSLTAVTPPGSVGPVDVVAVNPGNQRATLTGGFTYFEPIIPPTVSSITPATGPTAGGTTVTINGSLFKAGAEVYFEIGGTRVQATGVTIVSAVRLTAVTPASVKGVANVIVRNPADNFEGQLDNAFTFLAPPTITAVTPNTGLTAGGQTITITGTEFRAGATVRFGTLSGSSVTVDPSGNSLTVVTPVSVVNGVVNVTVTNSDTQTVTLPNAFTYAFPAPTVVSVTPNSGFAVGGRPVTITGTNFTPTVTSVTFGGVAATNVVRASATSITATTPAGMPGPVDVVVTNSDAQTATATGAYRYVPAPTLTAVSPAHGAVQGGTLVTLTGTDFLQGASVLIAGVPAFAVNVTSSTTATAVTNAGVAGVADVRIVNPDTQSATLTAAFTYDGAPTLTTVSPVSGSTAGGTLVTLRGSGFLTGARVLFGTDEGTSVTIVSPTELTVLSPARAVGVVAVKVINTDSQSAELARAYRFVAPPTLTAVAPTSGDVAGGTVVTLTGSGFNANSTVRFGGVASTQVSLVSDTELEAVSPAHEPGAVDVVVTTDGASATLTGGFTYTRGAPTLAALAPVSGSTAGGALLTLTGTGFATGATVTVGGVAATDVVVVSAELARAVVPAHAAGPVDVVFTNDDGQAATLTAGFTYVAPATGGSGLVDAGAGSVGTDPQPAENIPGGVSCGCSSFDGSMFSLGGMGLLLALSRRRRRS